MATNAIIMSTTLNTEHRSAHISKGEADTIFNLLRKTWSYNMHKIILIFVVYASMFTQKANNFCYILKHYLVWKYMGLQANL